MLKKLKKENRVAALAGRRIDPADAEHNHFPLTNIIRVQEDLRKVFTSQKITHLICSAACGADLLALETAYKLGLESHIVLPFLPTDFRKVSVIDRPGNWGEIYDRVIAYAEARDLLYVLNFSHKDNRAFYKATQHIVANAERLSEGTPAFSIAVWEGKSRGEGDATAEFVLLSQEAGFQLFEVFTG